MRDHGLPGTRRLPLLRDMLSENLAGLMQAVQTQPVPSMLEKIGQGAPADFLDVGVEGPVESHARWNRRKTTLAVVRSVGIFILAACIKDAPCLLLARTPEKSRIGLIPSSDLRALFRHDPEFSVATTVKLAGCHRAVMRQITMLKLRTALIAGWMLRAAALAGGARVLPREEMFPVRLAARAPPHGSFDRGAGLSPHRPAFGPSSIGP